MAAAACGMFHLARNSMSNGSIPVSDDAGDDEGIGRQVGEENDGANDRDLV